MKRLIFIFLFFAPFVYGQNVFPYLNNRDYLKSFHEGMTTQLDFLEPIHVKYSEEIIAFIDNKRDLFVFDGHNKEKLSALVNDYKIGIEIVAWNSGPIINVWENGVKQNLTYFGGHYEVSDSLVVFEDTRDYSIKVYYKGEIQTLYTSVGRPMFPKAIGSNTVAFEGNGDVHYAYTAGKIIEIGAISGNVKFSAGGNVIVFNDTFEQSFAVVLGRDVFNVEPITAKEYQAGYNIFAYIDRNDNLKAFINGEIVQLSTYATFFEVFRDMIVWGENGTFFTYRNGTRYEIANYIPEEYKIRDGIVAFRNLNGGVSLFRNETVEILSNRVNAPFEVNGNTVKIQVNEGNYDFFKNGYAYPTVRQ